MYFGNHRNYNLGSYFGSFKLIDHENHIFVLLDYENIPLGTNIMLIAALEVKIWLILHFYGHLGNHLDCHSGICSPPTLKPIPNLHN